MTVFEPESDKPSATADAARRTLRFTQLSFRRERPRYNPLYGRFVSFTKVLLPVIATAIIALIVVWPELSEQNNRFTLGPARIDPAEAENLRMINARFIGVDATKRPYAVTADSADQATAKSDEVTLVAPKADILLGNGAWVALTAQTGIFDREKQILELTGGVNLFHDSGYEFQTQSIVVDLAAGDAIGTEPVRGQGPFGQLRAEGFRIYNRGERVEFLGKSKLVIRPAAKGKS
jgi:lipopolysaccharide export system protein LptC